MDRTLISSEMASQLGLNVSSLPLGTVDTGFGSLTVPIANLKMDVFSDSQFSNPVLSVGILNDAEDPLGENFIGNDLLSTYNFWQMDASADGTTATFYASTSAVPEPTPFAFAAIGSIVALGYSWRGRRSGAAT